MQYCIVYNVYVALYAIYDTCKASKSQGIKNKEKSTDICQCLKKLLLIRLPFIAWNPVNGSHRDRYPDSSIANIVNSVKTLLYKVLLECMGMRWQKESVLMETKDPTAFFLKRG